MCNAMVLAIFLSVMLAFVLAFAVYMTHTGDKMLMLRQMHEQRMRQEDKMDVIDAHLKDSIDEHLSSTKTEDSTTTTWEQPPEIHNPRHKR